MRLKSSSFEIIFFTQQALFRELGTAPFEKIANKC